MFQLQDRLANQLSEFSVILHIYFSQFRPNESLLLPLLQQGFFVI